jgi:hypothetical protein
VLNDRVLRLVSRLSTERSVEAYCLRSLEATYRSSTRHRRGGAAALRITTHRTGLTPNGSATRGGAGVVRTARANDENRLSRAAHGNALTMATPPMYPTDQSVAAWPLAGREVEPSRFHRRLIPFVASRWES